MKKKEGGGGYSCFQLRVNLCFVMIIGPKQRDKETGGFYHQHFWNLADLWTGIVNLLFCVFSYSWEFHIFHSCERKYIIVTGILFLWQEIYYCSRKSILVTGNLFLWPEIYFCCPSFISLREKLLWQECYSNDSYCIP